MTRDDIIQMAQEAGWEMPVEWDAHDGFLQRLERFAALVAAEKDKETARLQDMLYAQLGELTALRAEKQMRGYIKQLKDPVEPLEPK